VILIVKQAGREDVTAEAPDGSTVMEALAGAGLRLDAPCGGVGRCGKCRLEITGDLDEPGPAELKHVAGRPGERLACLARVRGRAEAILAGQSVFSAVKGLGWSAPYRVDPALRRLELPERDRKDQKSVLDALDLFSVSPSALEALADLEAERQAGDLLVWRDELLAAWPAGQGPAETLAAAFDLGTTGLALAVLDLDNRGAVAFETALNPQTTAGGDVISRITYAAEGPDNLRVLQDLALQGLRDLLLAALGPERAARVGAATISGNATMLHLLAGVNPKSLAQAPYRPIFTGMLDLSRLAPRLGLAPWAKVLTPPSISAYVGGDIASGLLAVNLAERPGTVVFIDVGTNGEIVVSRDGRLAGASCAAGPALEGMNISCGMRAVSGAMDSFRLVDGRRPEFTVIGGGEPVGVCGSGLVDVCSELVKAGVIDRTGRLKASPDAPELVVDGRCRLSEKVSLEQKDVRQVQLAKGAIAAAMQMLLERLELTLDDLDEVVVAGSFGYHLRPESLLGIGLLPKAYRGPVTFVGNSSLAGAARLLLDRSSHAEIEKLARRVEVIELAFDPKFQDVFLSQLGF
jgi:uncharacterized 2Fe-2S/4Fe-4S cluster protein (DUF4445 family)